MKKNLAIFDFDGTLYDTVPANYAAYQETLAAHGFSLDITYFKQYCYGRHYKDFLPPIIGSDEELLNIIHKEKIACYPRQFDHVRENKSLFSLMHALRATHYIALVTTATKSGVMAILERFRRMEDFDLILTQEDIPKNKPAPDGFLMAMEHFGVGPEPTIIFEDSESGIAAAKASGAAYLVVREIL